MNDFFNSVPVRNFIERGQLPEWPFLWEPKNMVATMAGVVITCTVVIFIYFSLKKRLG